MLLEKPISSGDVVSVKLISGEEIIARFEEESSDTTKISKPMSVSLGPQGLGMIPFMFLGNKEKISLKNLHIISMVPAKKEAADQYMQSTTGIALS